MSKIVPENPPLGMYQQLGYFDALGKRPRAFEITPSTLFSPMVTDYTDGYNAGKAERERREHENRSA